MLKRDLPQLPIKGMIGLSLGEYAALIASNSLSFEEGIKLVADRARFMQQDADREISTLAAVLDPQLQEIKELITAQQENGQRVYIANYNSPRQIVVGGALTDLKATLVLDPQLQEIKELITAQQENGQRVYIANYNSPRQIVVGGALTDLKATLKKMEEDKLDPQLQEIKELITAQQENGQRVYIANDNSPRQIVVGGALTDLKATLKKMEEDQLAKRTILLKVNGAFQKPYFNGARQQMHNRLQTVDFHEPQIEVISNTTNSLFHCENLPGILEKQLDFIVRIFQEFLKNN